MRTSYGWNASQSQDSIGGSGLKVSATAQGWVQPYAMEVGDSRGLWGMTAECGVESRKAIARGAITHPSTPTSDGARRGPRLFNEAEKDGAPGAVAVRETEADSLRE